MSTKKHLARAVKIEHRLDDLEHRMVPLLGRPIDRIRYWKNTRKIMRGALLGMYLDD